jgi:hypothetical protein
VLGVLDVQSKKQAQPEDTELYTLADQVALLFKMRSHEHTQIASGSSKTSVAYLKDLAAVTGTGEESRLLGF